MSKVDASVQVLVTAQFPELLVGYVVPQYIANGKPGDCAKCPIALALQSKYPPFYVKVRNDVVLLTMTRVCAHVEYYRLPQRARAFITLFDYGGTDVRRAFKPFMFVAPRIGGRYDWRLRSE
jgi:hypothetical protein